MTRKTEQKAWPRHAAWARQDVIRLLQENAGLEKEYAANLATAITALDRKNVLEVELCIERARRVGAEIARNEQEMHRILIEAGVGRQEQEE